MSSQNALERVQPGQPFMPNAQHHNLTCEMLADWTGRRIRTGVGDVGVGNLPQTIIDVKNTTGEDQPRFAIAQINEPVFGPDDNLDGFKNGPTFKIITPQAATEQYAVLQTPLRKDAIGPAVIAGWTIAKVDCFEAAVLRGEYARVGASATAFDADVPGTIKILWRKAATGEQWAMVLLHAHAPLGIGKADADIAKGSDGTISVYRSDADTGKNITARARLGAIKSGKWVYFHHTGSRYEAVNAEC